MKKTFVILVLLIFSPNLFAWEKVPVPDSVDKKTKSPWNFFDDFEDQNFRKYFYKNNKCCGKGKEPYKFKQDPDGNTYLEITVKHGWNSNQERTTERAEISPKEKRAREKIIWYGFKVRLPKDFIHIDDRVLFSQFKNKIENIGKSPLLGIRFRVKGKRLNIGGNLDVGEKDRKREESSKYNKLLTYTLNECDVINYGSCYRNGKLIPESKRKKIKGKEWYLKEPKYKNISGIETFDATPLGEWATYKVGIYNTKTDSGFIKVYKDDVLIYIYEGATFDWKENYTVTFIRLGIYRDSDPRKEGYPPQTIHYDDFTVVSDKKTLDKYLK